MSASWSIRQGDVLDRLREMPDESVQCCITSPPYFGLRDYGVEGQIGLEGSPDVYVARLVEVFREVRRVLRGDGVVWLNLGDSYAAPGNGARDPERWPKQSRNNGGRALHAKRGTGCKPKDLLGIPWMVAFALRTDGWYLRRDIIWSKLNPMPESVMDRPTTAHEYIFLLSKSATYYYDAFAVREDDAGHSSGNGFAGRQGGARQTAITGGRGSAKQYKAGSGRNKRSVWEVATQPYADAHFAVWPEALVLPMVLAGSAPKACGECGAPWARVTERVDQGYDGSRYGERAVEATGGARSGGTARSTLGSSKGALVGARSTAGWRSTCEHEDDSGCSVVLDPFAGSGTTLKVAVARGRSAIGIELNPEYVALAERRLACVTAPLFSGVA